MVEFCQNLGMLESQYSKSLKQTTGKFKDHFCPVVECVDAIRQNEKRSSCVHMISERDKPAYGQLSTCLHFTAKYIPNQPMLMHIPMVMSSYQKSWRKVSASVEGVFEKQIRTSGRFTQEPERIWLILYIEQKNCPPRFPSVFVQTNKFLPQVEKSEYLQAAKKTQIKINCPNLNCWQQLKDDACLDNLSSVARRLSSCLRIPPLDSLIWSSRVFKPFFCLKMLWRLL